MVLVQQKEKSGICHFMHEIKINKNANECNKSDNWKLEKNMNICTSHYNAKTTCKITVLKGNAMSFRHLIVLIIWEISSTNFYKLSKWVSIFFCLWFLNDELFLRSPKPTFSRQTLFKNILWKTNMHLMTPYISCPPLKTATVWLPTRHRFRVNL